MSSPRADAERNVARVLRAAAKILAERPNATVAEIAARSGLGRATVYRHFGSRRELVGAIHRQAIEEAEHAIEGSIDAGGGPLEVLARVTGELLAVGDRYRIVAEQRSLEAPLRRRERRLAAPLIPVVEAGQASGEIRADLPAEWLVHALGGLIVAALRASREGILSGCDVSEAVTTTLIAGAAARDRDAIVVPTPARSTN